jgi:poly-gamma-glutamate biosynthesis protein PgsC/CapC
MDLLAIAIGVGLAVSLLFSEMFGLAAGGMVVPGYFALHLDNPAGIILTIAAAIATYFIVHLLSMIVIIYGKRRTVLMILVGYVLRMFLDFAALDSSLAFESFQSSQLLQSSELVVIGYIIPGLIAIWIDRQGLVETISTLITASVVVRLILIIVFGTEIRL